MLILLSPAKTLDFTTPIADEPTKPRFATDAARLARAAAKLGPDRLAELMHISDQLADLNHRRFKTFAKAEQRPAIRAFAGDVYRGFDAPSADADTLAFAQDHLRILSGLYGALRPLDAIRPYRLEMGTRWGPASDRLVDYWGDKVAKTLAKDLRADGSKLIANLASNEYFAVVKGKLPKAVRVIAPDFRVETAAGLKFHSFTAKVARGAMARWLCDERIADPAALPDFDRDGWSFDRDGSTAEVPLFVRR
ncbi:MAG: peroxide stress protein YaaA [Pseudomonadota bacterium]|nr:peroxide stress protein YaaA [Pseudomonadota bacterium]